MLLTGLLASPAPGDAAAGTVVTTRPDSSARAVSVLIVRDLRGDMVRLEEGADHGTPAPRATIGDVLRTTFRHTDRRVVARTRLAALKRTGHAFQSWIDIRRGSGRTWYVGLKATPRHRHGRITFMTGSGRDVSCAVAHRIDYATDVVRVSVPRRCLRNPARVRFGLVTLYYPHARHDARVDDALAASFGHWHWTRWLVPG